MVTFSDPLAITAPASSVWQIVRDFEHVDRWVIDLASCRPQGRGVGMLRHLVQKDGARVLEQLDGLDESTRTIRYHIVESDLPFSSYSSTIQMKSTGSESCEVVWTSTIEPRNIDKDHVLKMLKTNYLRYLEKLKMLCDSHRG